MYNEDAIHTQFMKAVRGRYVALKDEKERNREALKKDFISKAGYFFENLHNLKEIFLTLLSLLSSGALPLRC
jgi:hypothetical protein